jgi:hypothetical protein
VCVCARTRVCTEDSRGRQNSRLIFFPIFFLSLPFFVCVGCMMWTVGCMKILEASALSANLRRLSLARNDAGTPAAYVLSRLLKSDWGVRVGGREGRGRERGGGRAGGREGGREGEMKSEREREEGGGGGGGKDMQSERVV